MTTTTSELDDLSSCSSLLDPRVARLLAAADHAIVVIDDRLVDNDVAMAMARELAKISVGDLVTIDHWPYAGWVYRVWQVDGDVVDLRGVQSPAGPVSGGCHVNARIVDVSLAVSL